MHSCTRCICAFLQHTCSGPQSSGGWPTNKGTRRPTFGLKPHMFVGPRHSYCGPLQLSACSGSQIFMRVSIRCARSTASTRCFWGRASSRIRARSMTVRVGICRIAVARSCLVRPPASAWGSRCSWVTCTKAPLFSFLARWGSRQCRYYPPVQQRHPSCAGSMGLLQVFNALVA